MIGKKWKARQNRYLWGFDKRVPVSGRKSKRVRIYEFLTREDAEEALGIYNAKIKQSAHGIAVSAAPLLIDLIRHRVAGLTLQNEIGREKRVLVGWLHILDPSIDSAERLLARIKSSVRVVDATSESIKQYADKRRREGLSSASVKRELTIIAATIHQADQFSSELVQWRPPRIPYPKVRNSRRERVITEQEYRAIVSCLTRKPGPLDGDRLSDQRNAYEARLRVAHIFQFAMHSGMRHSEIVGLKWSDIDRRNNRILILQGKTGRYKQIPITKKLAAILKARESNGQDFIFTKTGKIYPKFYRILKAACELCGVAYGKNTPGGIVLHTSRHTVTTRLVTDGMDYDTIGQITGHSAKELIAHYSHHSPASMKRAAEALENIGGQLADTTSRKYK